MRWGLFLLPFCIASYVASSAHALECTNVTSQTSGITWRVTWTDTNSSFVELQPGIVNFNLNFEDNAPIIF